MLSTLACASENTFSSLCSIIWENRQDRGSSPPPTNCSTATQTLNQITKLYPGITVILQDATARCFIFGSVYIGNTENIIYFSPCVPKFWLDMLYCHSLLWCGITRFILFYILLKPSFHWYCASAQSQREQIISLTLMSDLFFAFILTEH